MSITKVLNILQLFLGIPLTLAGLAFLAITFASIPDAWPVSDLLAIPLVLAGSIFLVGGAYTLVNAVNRLTS